MTRSKVCLGTHCRRGSAACIHPFSLKPPHLQPKQADVAELADALDSGSSGGNPVEVQVLSSALN